MPPTSAHAESERRPDGLLAGWQSAKLPAARKHGHACPRSNDEPSAVTEADCAAAVGSGHVHDADCSHRHDSSD
jgi:hypothetical protein